MMGDGRGIDSKTENEEKGVRSTLKCPAVG
jgi:hypothetical protein